MMHVKLILYTQNDCVYCEAMKMKLENWGYTWDEVNLNKMPEQKAFMKEQGHKTVPQLYWNNKHLNKVNTHEFTKELMEEQMEWDNYVGGVESFRSIR